MANVEKIDSLVSAEATKQVTELKAALSSLHSEMVTVLSDTEKLYSESGKIDTIKKIIAANNQYAESSKKLTDLQRQYASISDKLSQATEKLRIAEEKLASSRDKAQKEIVKRDALERERINQLNQAETEIAKMIIAEEKLNAILSTEAKTESEAIAQLKQLKAARLDVNKETDSGSAKLNVINEAIKRNKTFLDSLNTSEEKAAVVKESTSAKTVKLTAYERELNAQRNASEKQAAKIRIAEEQLNMAMARVSTTSAEAIAQNKQLRAAILNLNPAWESEKVKIDQINAIINKNDTLITSVGDNMVKQKRNIGNYASGFNPLNNAMAQLTREGPAFANSIATGFMAISNNIPILRDAIKAIIAQNAILKAEGKQTVSALKQVTMAFLSWETAISVGIVLLTMYGAKLFEWIGSLFKSVEAIEATTVAQKALNNARLEGDKNVRDEVNKLKLLYNASTDSTRSLKERKAATDELQKIYPDYFSNMEDEYVMAGNASKVYKELTTSIIANSRAKAQLGEMDKLSAENWDLSMKAAGKLIEIQKTEILLQAEKNKGRQVDAMGREITNVDAYTNKLATLKDEYGVLTSSIRATATAQIALEKTIDVKALTFTPKETKKPTTNDNTLNNDNKEVESLLEEERKLRLNAQKIIFSDENKSYAERLEALDKYTADSVTNVKMSADAELKEENAKYEKQKSNKKISDKDREQLETNHALKINVIKDKAEQESANVMSEGDKTRESLLLKQLADTKKALDAEIASMEDGYDKEAAIRASAMNNSFTELANSYKKQKISKEEYEKAKLDVTQEYINKELELQLQLATKEASLLTGDDKEKKLKEIAQIEATIAKNNIKNIEQQTEADKKLKEDRVDNLKDYADKAKDLLGGITGLVSAIYEGEINKIEEDQEAYDDAADAKIAKIEEQEEKGVITSEQATARKKVITDAQTKYDAEADKKKTELKKKQAKLDKLSAIAAAAINTAVGITAALATGPAGIPIAIAIGIMGALELATIIATPLAYAKGTPKGGHKGGDAIVGDGGKHETLITSKGIFKTPDKPTFIPDLEQGAIVLPDFNEASMALLNSSMAMPTTSRYDDINVTNKIDSVTGELREIKNVLKKNGHANRSSDLDSYKYKILGR